MNIDLIVCEKQKRPRLQQTCDWSKIVFVASCWCRDSGLFEFKGGKNELQVLVSTANTSSTVAFVVASVMSTMCSSMLDKVFRIVCGMLRSDESFLAQVLLRRSQIKYPNPSDKVT